MSQVDLAAGAGGSSSNDSSTGKQEEAGNKGGAAAGVAKKEGTPKVNNKSSAFNRAQSLLATDSFNPETYRRAAFKPTVDQGEAKEDRADSLAKKGKAKREARLQNIRTKNLVHSNNDAAFFDSKSQEIQASISSSIDHVESGGG